MAFSINCGINENLIIATMGNNSKKVKELISKGADVNVKDVFGNTLLHSAAQFGYYEIVEILLDNKADTNAKDENNFTPVHYAIANGHKEIVKLFLEAGIDVNARNINGDTLLHNAVRERNKDIAELLLGAGADSCLRNNNQQTAAALAQVKVASADTANSAKAAQVQTLLNNLYISSR